MVWKPFPTLQDKERTRKEMVSGTDIQPGDTQMQLAEFVPAESLL